VSPSAMLRQMNRKVAPAHNARVRASVDAYFEGEDRVNRVWAHKATNGLRFRFPFLSSQRTPRRASTGDHAITNDSPVASAQVDTPPPMPVSADSSPLAVMISSQEATASYSTSAVDRVQQQPAATLAQAAVHATDPFVEFDTQFSAIHGTPNSTLGRTPDKGTDRQRRVAPARFMDDTQLLGWLASGSGGKTGPSKITLQAGSSPPSIWEKALESLAVCVTVLREGPAATPSHSP